MAMILYPPFPPMEALSVSEIPVGTGVAIRAQVGWLGSVVFREGKSVTLQSKAGNPLTRYFPDLVDMVRSIRADRFVLDGEIVVAAGKVFSFDALLQRIRHAESRVKKLAKETPALMIVFDLLADQSGVQIDRSLQDRRQCLEAFALKHFRKKRSDALIASDHEARGSEEVGLSRVGATLDGIIAERRGHGHTARAIAEAWQPLEPNSAVEVKYDHFSGDRFRHGTSLMRWRPGQISKAVHYGSSGPKEGRPD